jgi:hypothetical protein
MKELFNQLQSKFLYITLAFLVTGCSSTSEHYIKPTPKENFFPNVLLFKFMSENNDNQQMNILTKRGKKDHERWRKHYGGRFKYINFSNIKRVDNTVFSLATLTYPPKYKHANRGAFRLFFVFEVKNGKIDFMTYSGPPTKKRWFVAESGQTADTISTGIGLAQGLVEANPIMGAVINTGGIPALGAVKLGMTQLIKRYSLETCLGHTGGLSAVGWGAAALNMTAVLGGGLAAVPIGIAIGKLSAPKRRTVFWECVPPEIHKHYLTTFNTQQ